jgi:tripartite-type tricarboxylate transporter receptor subunit TctC
MNKFKFAVIVATSAAGVVPLVGAASAEEYPSHAITMIVPFAAGGPSDVVARIVAESMAKTLKQSIVIENVGGAGGTTGSARVAAANPDGYTLLSGSMGSHVAAPSLYANLKYDSRKDFEPVAMVMNGPAVVVARKTIPATNLKEFIAYIKANRGKVSQGHGGVGASSHMACLLFNTEAGVTANVVAYRGSAPALNDVVAGQIDYVCDSTMGMAEQIKAGTVKAFAITSPQRSPALPQVPTSKEGGLPRYDLSIWSAVFAPKGTPKEIVAKLNDAVSKALDDPSVISRFEALGGTVVARNERTPKYLAETVTRETARWEPILKSAVAAAATETKAEPKK